MATKTRTELRVLLSEAIGDADWGTLTTTSNGNAGGTTLIDTGLADLSEDDDAFPGWYIHPTSGDTAGETGRIKGASGYDFSNVTLTLATALTAQVVSGVTYEIGRYNPILKHLALARASEILFPRLWLPIRDETLVIDNVLLNADGETFDSTFTNWTHTAGTWTQETTSGLLIWHGSASFKGVASGAAAQLTSDNLIVNSHEITGRTFTAKFRVYATDASAARIRVDWDGGSTFSNSSYHTGADQWELLEVRASVPAAATQIQVILEIADGSTAYFDAGWAKVDRVDRYTIPTTIIEGPHKVGVQPSENYPDGEYLPLDAGPLSTGRILRLEGMGFLSVPTTDAGTVEVDAGEAGLLVARAAEYMAFVLHSRTSNPRLDLDMWRAEVRRLEDSGIGRRPMAAAWPKGWHTEADASGRYLIIER
jgi:hypothetical protein